jgi:hypothetical protein
LISSIADDQRRWTTLSKLSLLIAGERKDSKTNEFEHVSRTFLLRGVIAKRARLLQTRRNLLRSPRGFVA